MGRIEHPLLDGDKPPIRPKTVARNHTIPKKVTSIFFLLHGLGHFWFRTSIFGSEWIFGARPVGGGLAPKPPSNEEFWFKWRF
jgi:hypothetical protein